MYENFRRRLWIGTSIILGSFLIFGAFFLAFRYFLDTKVEEVLASRAIISQRSMELETLNKLKTDASAAESIQQKIDALLPQQDLLIGFPQFLNNLSRNYSLSLIFNFNGTPVSGTATTPGYVDFSAVVEGDAGNIGLFVNELETKTVKFMVNLDKFLLTPSSGNISRADVRGRVFFQENKSL